MMMTASTPPPIYIPGPPCHRVAFSNLPPIRVRCDANPANWAPLCAAALAISAEPVPRMVFSSLERGEHPLMQRRDVRQVLRLHQHASKGRECRRVPHQIVVAGQAV